MADFLLVHGAWHGGWCWKRLTPLLRAAGHEVFAPTLTGLGERAHLMSADIGLDTHIQDVIGVLECEDLRDVILVGHSYGGMVITGVAGRVPERIAHLVYLDAFVPEDGKALVDYLPPEMVQMFHDRTRTEGGGYMLPEVYTPEAFGVTDPDDLAWVRPRTGPHPFKTKLDAVRLGDLRAVLIPRTFVYCHAPPAGPFGQFAERVRHDPAWGYFELPSGHDAMVTHPESLAGILLQVGGPGPAGERVPVSLEGPVVLVDGELQLRIPLAAGGSELIEMTQDVARVEGDYLVVVIPEWLAAKLGISAGSLVGVDDSEGGFNIWPLDTPVC